MMKRSHITVENHVIVFMDIHEYSIAMKMLGKNQYGGFLQEFYETLGDIIVAYNGEIIKYMGDALLCVFPADSESETIQCALELRKAYFDLVRRKHITHETELEIGISSGEIEIGIIGHPSLRQKDVFGEEVNRATTIGHHRGIAITESVYEKIKKIYQTNKLPDFKVKWQDKPLQVWEIIE